MFPVALNVGPLVRCVLVPGAFLGVLSAAWPAMGPWTTLLLAVGFMLLPELVQASAGTGTGANPWTDGIQVICQAFGGVIGRSLAIVAVVVGGLLFAFGEGGSKSAIASLIFGAGMVLGAVNFLTWLNLGGGVGAGGTGAGTVTGCV